MVTNVTSFSNSEKTYDVTVENGVAVDCTCKSRQYRKGHQCRHMKAMQTSIIIEIDRAATFLALKKQVQEIAETTRANRALAFNAY